MRSDSAPRSWGEYGLVRPFTVSKCAPLRSIGYLYFVLRILCFVFWEYGLVRTAIHIVKIWSLAHYFVIVLYCICNLYCICICICICNLYFVLYYFGAAIYGVKICSLARHFAMQNQLWAPAIWHLQKYNLAPREIWYKMGDCNGVYDTALKWRWRCYTKTNNLMITAFYWKV